MYIVADLVSLRMGGNSAKKGEGKLFHNNQHMKLQEPCLYNLKDVEGIEKSVTYVRTRGKMGKAKAP